MRKDVYVALYPRVSTSRQYEDGYSIGEQIDRLTKYCEAKGWKVFKIYTDAGYSGANTDRPALKEMVKAVEDGLVDIVLVYKLDRLSRSQKDTLSLIEHFEEHNVGFVSVTESFDTSTPYGKAMLGLLAVFAQLERDQIRERMSEGKKGRAKQGKFNGGRYSPVGYDYIDGELVVNEYESMLVKEGFRLFNNRVPVNTICNRFNKAGLEHRSKWTPRVLKYMLRNKTYLGYIKHSGEYYQGHHTPLIDQETFDKAQELLKERAHSKTAHAFSYTSYFGGLIWCGNCGARYHKKPNRGENQTTYSCYSRTKQNKNLVKDPNCKNRHVKMHELDLYLFDQIRRLAVDDSFLNDGAEMKKAETALQIELLQLRIDEIDGKIGKLIDLYSIGSMDMNAVKEKVDALSSDKAKLKVEIDALTDYQPTDAAEVRTVAMGLDEALESGDFDGVRSIVETLIERVVIEEDNVKIYWKFC